MAAGNSSRKNECFLMSVIYWGDVCGYIWGKSNRRIEVLIVNERQKQTYYGALITLITSFGSSLS